MPNFKELKSKKTRDEAGLFLVEGEKFIAEIPENHLVRYFLISRKYADTHDFSQLKQRARCEIVRDSIFEKFADTVTPQGVIAVCEKVFYKPEEILGGGFILMGENLNDPGNVGALVRTAAAAGARGAIFTQGSCDVFSPKVIRASAGAVFRLPIITNAEAQETLSTLKRRDAHAVKIYAAHPRGEFLPYDLNMRENFCLLVGNESRGISDAALALADQTVRLPMTKATESLNASIAGSILLYEAVRQRM